MPASRIRFIDLETGGNGPNDVCEIGWQDVVLCSNGQWRVNKDRGAPLVNPGRPMSPATMAVHLQPADDSPFVERINAGNR